eukprot:scaffold622960_cov23-Prasinocladus_malaysianus.AAC.1
MLVCLIVLSSSDTFATAVWLARMYDGYRRYVVLKLQHENLLDAKAALTAKCLDICFLEPFKPLHCTLRSRA